jgi:hypothetical protein
VEGDAVARRSELSGDCLADADGSAGYESDGLGC